MSEIKNKLRVLEAMLAEVEDEDTKEEIQAEFKEYSDKLKAILACSDIEEFVVKHHEASEIEAVTQEIEENNQSITDIKLDALNAAIDTLEEIIADLDAEY